MKTSSSQVPSTRKSERKHFYQFYKGREDLFRIAIPFLQSGLENKEAGLWVVSRTIGLLEAVQAFQMQFDLTPFVENTQLLILPAERWYLDRGRFSEERVFEKLKAFVSERTRRGFFSYRVVGDLDWLDTKQWPRFQSYEQKAHQWIQEEKLTAICAYPIKHCSLTGTKDVVDHHDSAFLSRL